MEPASFSDAFTIVPSPKCWSWDLPSGPCLANSGPRTATHSYLNGGKLMIIHWNMRYTMYTRYTRYTGFQTNPHLVKSNWGVFSGKHSESSSACTSCTVSLEFHCTDRLGTKPGRWLSQHPSKIRRSMGISIINPYQSHLSRNGTNMHQPRTKSCHSYHSSSSISILGGYWQPKKHHFADLTHSQSTKSTNQL